jgi:hypothetical protein
MPKEKDITLNKAQIQELVTQAKIVGGMLEGPIKLLVDERIFSMPPGENSSTLDKFGKALQAGFTALELETGASITLRPADKAALQKAVKLSEHFIGQYARIIQTNPTQVLDMITKLNAFKNTVEIYLPASSVGIA